jgi:hypothetical protein
MEFFIADIFFEGLGWMFLFLKYCDTKKVAVARHADFDDSYAVAGRAIAVKALLVLFGVLILGVLVAMVIGLMTSCI